MNAIYPNMWAPTAGLLQGLTVVQQCVYQMKFMNVCEVKKRLVQPGLVWSITLSILLSMNGEAYLCLCSHSGQTHANTGKAILLQAAKK